MWIYSSGCNGLRVDEQQHVDPSIGLKGLKKEAGCICPQHTPTYTKSLPKNNYVKTVNTKSRKQ